MIRAARLRNRRGIGLAAAGLACLLAGACTNKDAMPTPTQAQAAVYEAAADAAPSPRVTFTPSELPTVTLSAGDERHIASVLNVQKRMDYGNFVWNDHGIPPGNDWVLIDLKAQTMSIFRGQDEIGTAVVLYGVDNMPTPTGRFSILAKSEHHRSSLYDAAMPYTLRLTNDGVSIHGSDVRSGVGSHGCVGVPLEFARHLFAELRVGDPVVIAKDAATLIQSHQLAMDNVRRR